MRVNPNRSWTSLISAVALAMAAVTGISACSSTSPTTSSSSPATGQHLTASEFSTAMKTPGTVVLDVRTPAEFATGHLPKAQNIDFEASDFATRIAALDKNTTYAIYCRSGSRSGAAMEQMAAASFTHVYDLAGGIGAWQTMGGPMSMGG